jgi:hypothetical protein
MHEELLNSLLANTEPRICRENGDRLFVLDVSGENDELWVVANLNINIIHFEQIKYTIKAWKYRGSRDPRNLMRWAEGYLG